AGGGETATRLDVGSSCRAVNHLRRWGGLAGEGGGQRGTRTVDDVGDGVGGEDEVGGVVGGGHEATQSLRARWHPRREYRIHVHATLEQAMGCFEGCESIPDTHGH